MGSSRIRKLFQKARSSAPCIIFIDEIDALGKRGSKMNSNTDSTLNQLLVEMDGFGSGDNTSRDNIVLVIAATNRPNLIDSALKRKGRFDRHVTVALPDRQGRCDIFKVHLQKIRLESIESTLSELDAKSLSNTHKSISNSENINPTSLLEISKPDIEEELKEKDGKQDPSLIEIAPNPKPLSLMEKLKLVLNHKKQISSTSSILSFAEKLSRMSTGFSGADIANICNEAAILSCRSNSQFVVMEKFDLAIERYILLIQCYCWFS